VRRLPAVIFLRSGVLLSSVLPSPFFCSLVCLGSFFVPGLFREVQYIFLFNNQWVALV